MSALLIWKPAVASSTSPKDALAAIPKCFWMSPWEPFGSQDALYRFKAPLAPWHNRLVSCCKATFIPRFTFPRSIGYMDFGHILDTLDKFWTHIGHKDFGHICLLPARSSSIICMFGHIPSAWPCFAKQSYDVRHIKFFCLTDLLTSSFHLHCGKC